MRNVTNSSPLEAPLSSHAHRLGHPQLRHAIEHRAFHPRFGALRSEVPRPELPSEHPLESEHRILGNVLACGSMERIRVIFSHSLSTVAFGLLFFPSRRDGATIHSSRRYFGFCRSFSLDECSAMLLP